MNIWKYIYNDHSETGNTIEIDSNDIKIIVVSLKICRYAL